MLAEGVGLKRSIRYIQTVHLRNCLLRNLQRLDIPFDQDLFTLAKILLVGIIIICIAELEAVEQRYSSMNLLMVRNPKELKTDPIAKECMNAWYGLSVGRKGLVIMVLVKVYNLHHLQLLNLNQNP